MNKLRQAVQLALGTDMSNRAIGREVGIAYNSVRRYRSIARENGYELTALLRLGDEDLTTRFQSAASRWTEKRLPDWPQVHAELQRKHVTLQLLWGEYCGEDPDSAYRYSQFTHYYREWAARKGLSMRQKHTPGERGWVDFLGRTMQWVDPVTGEQHTAQIFAAALGVSHLLFAHAVPSQSSEWWIECHNQWYAFLGGAPAITVPDNLKAAVLKAGSDPQINPTYLEMGRHYNTVILPARPRKPKDKSKAEGGVLIIERWALAGLRNRTFHSIAEINDALRERLDLINNRPMRVYKASRRERFQELDLPMLQPLPPATFEYGEWLPPMRVTPDYHLTVKGHHYSVPHGLVGESVTVRVSAAVIEMYHKRQRVGSHIRSNAVGEATTDPVHQPDSHRAWSQQSPDRYRAWAATIGPNALAVVEHQLASAKHESLALKACGGLQGIARTYGMPRFEGACGEAIRIKSPTRKSIRSLLQNGLDQRARRSGDAPAQMPKHENVRGPAYYRNEEKACAD